MFKYKSFILLLIIISIFFITGCSNKKLNMESKIESEIDFCEGRILIFLKKCEYDEYVKDGSLDWEYIINDTNDFSNSFPTIEADLSNVNYDNSKIEEIKASLTSLKTYAQNKELDKLKKEYGILYSKVISIKNNDNRNFKNKCMQIYITSLENDKQKCNNLIAELEVIYETMKQKDDFLEINKFSLNRIHDNILDLKSALEAEEYQRIRAHSLKIVEIM